MATDLYDVRRLAELLGVKPATVRSMRHRKQLPAPTSKDINGGAVWAREIVQAFFGETKGNLGQSLPSKFREGIPPVIDLFSGCGGMSLGFQLAGFRVLEGFENWRCAIDTYNFNLDHQSKMIDLGDLEATFEELDRFKIDDQFPAIIGGPPCQDFSSAGSRIEGARADLTEKYAAVVERFRPPFFVMENVARTKNAAAFQRALAVMSDAGYFIDYQVLDASLCGVPQKRKRLITIGTLDRELTSRIYGRIQQTLAERPMTVREWFGNRLEVDHYYRHPRSYARRAVFSVDEPSPTIRGVNRPVPEGYPGHPGDTVSAASTRPLTTQERAEIQTFPRGFQFVGSRTDTEQMIGNAVPVRLAKFVGEAIASEISG